MGLKKRTKPNADFSMSSLTDIIFLLLIFFMLTSNFVTIDAANLPESDSKTVAPTSAVVSVDPSGNYMLNKEPVSMSALERELRQAVREAENKEEFTVTIVAEKETPFERVVGVMQVAGKLKIKTILATQPKKG